MTMFHQLPLPFSFQIRARCFLVESIGWDAKAKRIDALCAHRYSTTCCGLFHYPWCPKAGISSGNMYWFRNGSNTTYVGLAQKSGRILRLNGHLSDQFVHGKNLLEKTRTGLFHFNSFNHLSASCRNNFVVRENEIPRCTTRIQLNRLVFLPWYTVKDIAVREISPPSWSSTPHIDLLRSMVWYRCSAKLPSKKADPRSFLQAMRHGQQLRESQLSCRQCTKILERVSFSFYFQRSKTDETSSVRIGRTSTPCDRRLSKVRLIANQPISLQP